MASDSATGDFDTVLGDPAAFYRHPQAILADTSLNAAERRALLLAWQQDIADRNSAVGEGMVPDHHGATDRDVKLGGAVAEALTLVPEDAPEGLMAMTGRLWRRLVGD